MSRLNIFAIISHAMVGAGNGILAAHYHAPWLIPFMLGFYVRESWQHGWIIPNTWASNLQGIGPIITSVVLYYVLR